MSISLSQLVLILIAVIGAFAWRDFKEALSLEELKSDSKRKGVGAYAPLARLSPVLKDGASVWIAPLKEVNAFVASGREIFVTEGLNKLYMKGALTAEQMAAILAHELAHIDCGHYQRSRRLADAETIGGVVVNKFGWLGRMLYSHGAAATRAKLSRTAEFEADARAAELLRRCGLSPKELAGALEAFGRLHQRAAEKAEAGGGEDAGDGDREGEAAPRRDGLRASWLDTHPPIPERIARLQALARD